MKPSTTQKIEGQWDQMRGKIVETWEKVTDNDLTTIRGKADQVVVVIKEKTGETRDAIENRLDQLAERLPGR